MPARSKIQRSLSLKVVKEKFMKAKGKLSVIRTLGSGFGGNNGDNGANSMSNEIQRRLNEVSVILP
jgi:hypothetical protein